MARLETEVGEDVGGTNIGAEDTAGDKTGGKDGNYYCSSCHVNHAYISTAYM